MTLKHPRSPPRTVLVVEDEVLIAMELIGILKGGGYETFGPAVTVEAALGLISRDTPSACVLDVNLRGVTSYRVAGALKARGVPFVISSAYDRASLDRYVEFVDVANIGKPVSSVALLETLASLLGK